MNEEKRSICDAIFSAIQDDIRNLCDVSFGKNEITERIAVLVDLVKPVWNDDMFI